MTLIDTHTHLYDEAFDNDRNEVVEAALKAGVEWLVTPAVDSRSAAAMTDLCSRYPQCLPLAGVHPTSVDEVDDWRAELELTERALSEQTIRYYGIGEVGLDLYWSSEHRAEQIELFERQIELSLQYDLPLSIHTRNAWDEMIDTLARYRSRGLRGVMHAFNAPIETYSTIKSLGDFRFGIGGVVTYRRSGLAEVVAQMELDDLVLETDSPYLPPVPYRGKRNQSSYITYICQMVAQIKSIDSDTVARTTSKTALTLFGIDKGE